MRQESQIAGQRKTNPNFTWQVKLFSRVTSGWVSSAVAALVPKVTRYVGKIRGLGFFHYQPAKPQQTCPTLEYYLTTSLVVLNSQVGLNSTGY